MITIPELCEKLGFEETEDGIYTLDNISVDIKDTEVIVTETLQTEDEGNKITALVYAAGKLGEAKLVLEKEKTCFLPDDFSDLHSRFVIVHYIAHEAAIVRPLKIFKIQYQPNIDVEDLVKQTIEQKRLFTNSEIKFLTSVNRLHIYLETSYNLDAKNENRELLVDMFNRQPHSETEEIIINALRQVFQAKYQPQTYNREEHEPNHPAHPLDE